MTDHLTTVGGIYEAFGRGDIPFLLDQLADDVAWEQWADWTPQQAGVPWLRARSGKAGAMEFFQIIGAWTFTDFQVRAIFGSGNHVGADCKVAVRMPESGVTLEDEELHLWTFDDAGKVIRFRHYVDTAKQIAAAQHA